MGASPHVSLIEPGEHVAIETELRELIDRSFPSADAHRLTIFAERLFAREELRERVPASRRLSLVQSALDFFSVRDAVVIARVEPVPGEDTLTVVETVTTDCPFIVDSLLEYFHHLGATVRTMLHPVIKVARDGSGHLISMEQSSAAERGESFVHAELELPWSAAEARKIQDDVISILTEVGDATGDFNRMTERSLQICEETAANRELVEVRDFLRWLVQGGFVFLGYRRYLVTHQRWRASQLKNDAVPNWASMRRGDPRFRRLKTNRRYHHSPRAIRRLWKGASW